MTKYFFFSAFAGTFSIHRKAGIALRVWLEMMMFIISLILFSKAPVFLLEK